MMKLIECVPNFSEGRDLDVVHAICDRIAAVEGASVLHVTADESHNRSVITFVAPAEVMVDAAFAAIRAARDLIDITRHAGVHPRIGAADVVPFVPLEGATMQDCVAIARTLGARVGTELAIPVYLYERAASRDSRRNLADVRRGGFETLRDVIASDPERAPDFGPSEMHPTFGAVAIGARPFLVAFNAYIGDASMLAVAKEIARAVRASSGGLPAVKALGLEVGGEAQVSMNLVDIERTPLSTVYAAVEREAIARGAEITWSEIIGLVPESVVLDVAEHTLRLRDPLAGHMLEHRLLAARAGEQTLRGYLEAIGDSSATPGGGSVAAIAGALAAALARMVAGLTTGRARYAPVEGEMRAVETRAQALVHTLEALAHRDAEAYAQVIDAQKLPNETPGDARRRDAALHDALLAAARVPLDVCRASEEVALLTEVVAERGNPNAVTDAGVAAALATAACTGASYNVRVNVLALRDPSHGAALVTEAVALARSAASIAARVARRVEAAL
ncbi:MAG TPA: glutamate formimidoyltransferase, partial [Candidatus Elarobacter sp.]|nr:glutamate formimidoyltransferase [Candidatus Elarobacter sp.]